MLAKTLLALALSASMASAAPLVIGVTDFPPYFIIEGDEVGGIAGDSIAKVFAELDVAISMKVRPIARLKTEFNQGLLDCRIAAYGEKSEERYFLSRVPLYRLGYAAFVYGQEIQSLEDRGLSWGLLHGITYDPVVESRLLGSPLVFRGSDNRENLLNLARGKLDVVVAELLTFLYLAEREDLGQELMVLDPSLYARDYFLICNRDRPEVEVVLGLFDQQIADFRASSEGDEILNRYLSEESRKIFLQMTPPGARSEGLTRTPR